MIEKHYDTTFVAQLAQREKQIQQSYRPVIGIHKWFARRPGALFRSLLLSEFADTEALHRRYFKSQDLGPLIIGDPFMGGGTPLLEANQLGCHVIGTDINPMAYWIVRQELAPLDRKRFREAAEGVASDVQRAVGHLYETTCESCGNPHASAKYFLWVKQQSCTSCGESIELYSSHVVSKNQRHPNYVVVCPICGALTETDSLVPTPGACRSCGTGLSAKGTASRNEVLCRKCGETNRYPSASGNPPVHHLYAIEYHCARCEATHKGRFFKAPDDQDLARVQEAEQLLAESKQDLIPDELIPPGDETTRLHRWGYRRYRELFSTRQLLGLQTLANAIDGVEDETTRHALLTVFSDILRYQNMLCRYDTYALKILDVFSVHGFPVGLSQCENSLLGVPNVGSGGFRHFVAKYDRAKAYCETPFEKTLTTERRPIYLRGEKVLAHFALEPPTTDSPKRTAYLQAAPATSVKLAPASLDAVLTDPPYFANVQYAELMDFCYVWLRRHLEDTFPAFASHTTRAPKELTVNTTEGRDILDYTEGLSNVFRTYAMALKPGAPFAFTFHHNDPEAYLPIAVAVLDAKLVATASLPCPAEMGASIHINGTRSSTIDTVFVCRSTGNVPAKEFSTSVDYLSQRLNRDIRDLTQAGVEPSMGDVRCMTLGHLVRLAVWQLHSRWAPSAKTGSRLEEAWVTMDSIVPLDAIDDFAKGIMESIHTNPLRHMLPMRQNGE